MVNRFTEAQKKNTENEPRTLKRCTRDRPVISNIIKKFENLQNKKQNFRSHTAEHTVNQKKDLTSPRDDPRTDEKRSCHEENPDHQTDPSSEIVCKCEEKLLCSCGVVENVNECVMTEELHERNKEIWTLASFTDSDTFQQHINTNKTRQNNIKTNPHSSETHLQSEDKPSRDLHTHHHTPQLKRRTDEHQTFRSCDETQDGSRSEICVSSDGDTDEISSELKALDEVSCDLRTSPSAAEEENSPHLIKYKSMSYSDPSVNITHIHKTLTFTDTFNF